MNVDTSDRGLEHMNESASTPSTTRGSPANSNVSTSSSQHWEPHTVMLDLTYEVSKAGLGAIPLGRSLHELSLYSANHKMSKRRSFLDGFQWLQRFSFASLDGGLPLVRIEPESAGSQAGLLACDVIVAVNGEDVRTKTAKQTAAVLRSHEKLGPSVDLTVIRCLNLPYDAEAVSTFADPDHKADHYRITVTVKPSEDGYGFTPLRYSLMESSQVPRSHKHMIKAVRKVCSFATAVGGLPVEDVESGRPADDAGLRPWDVIIAVNGINVCSLTREEIAEIMSKIPKTEATEFVCLRSVAPILDEDISNFGVSPKSSPNPIRRAIMGLHRLSGREGANSKVKQGQRADTWEDMVVTADIVDGVRAN